VLTALVIVMIAAVAYWAVTGGFDEIATDVSGSVAVTL
jgi:hypothetical protein